MTQNSTTHTGQTTPVGEAPAGEAPKTDEAFCDDFGVCPKCGRHDGYLNLHRAHYFVCHAHRFKWCVGENLFSSWRCQSEAEFRRNALDIRSYDEIRPVALK